MIPITHCSSKQGICGQRGERGSFQLASVLDECNSCLQLSFMFSFLYFYSLLNRTCVEKGLYSQNYGFTRSHAWIWQLDHKEGRPLKYQCFPTVVLEILGSPFNCKEIKSVHSKGNQSWIFIGRTDAEYSLEGHLATWREELTHWKRPWCWERLKVGGEADDRGWDGWMTSPSWWIWIWANFRT